METSVTRRRLTAFGSLATVFIAACGGSTGSTSPNAQETANPNAVFGGTITIGAWQEPGSFLAANITDSQTFGVAIDAPAMEGLLWYKSADQTRNAKTLADYWQPWLATQVPTTDNGLVKTSGCAHADAKMCVTWPLRSDVTWHDGSKFTSHDVCDTFQFWWLKYKGQNPTALTSTSGWDQVNGCDEPDPQHAVVSFSAPYGPYLSLGTGVYGVIPSSVLDKTLAGGADLAKFSNDSVDLTKGSGNADAFKGKGTLDLITIGTGPFVLEKYEQGKQIIYVANKNYWNKAHMPHVDKIVIKFETDLNAQVTDVKTGAIDMSWDNRLYNLKALNAASALGKIRIQSIPNSGAEKLDLNLCANANGACGSQARLNPFTSDLIIRKAMLMGIDREGIVLNQAAGKTSVPKDSSMYLGVEYVDDPSIPKTKFDRAAANKLLDDTGYKLDPKCDGGKYRSKNGQCIIINIGTTSSNPSRVDIEGLVADDLGQIGIKVPQPFADNRASAGEFFGNFGAGGPLYTHKFDIALYTNTVSSPAEPDSYYAGYHGTCGGTCGGADPRNQIPAAVNKGSGQNDTGIDDPQLDAAMDAGRTAVNLSERAKHYLDAEKRIAAILPEIPLFQQVTVNTYSSPVQGLLPNDLVWSYNSYDWYCTAGKCQA